jgi:hypothetical protein
MAVLADEDGALIAGHARVRAAAKLGLPSIPVIVARGWSEEEKRAYRVADNQLAARGSWDLEQFGKELGDLKFDKFDLGLIGFEPDQLDKILSGLGPNGRSDPDSVPELPQQPATSVGRRVAARRPPHRPGSRVCIDGDWHRACLFVLAGFAY